MSTSHVEEGLTQRAWLEESEEDAERSPEVIQEVLEGNLELVEEGFSPRGIEAFRGAPDDIIEAGSGEEISDLDLEKLAKYLSKEKWNYGFNADISEGKAEIGVDEAKFDLWYSGATKVLGRYGLSNPMQPDIRAVREAYPDREIKFDGRFLSTKPAEAEEVYERAVIAKKEALREVLNSSAQEMRENLEEATWLGRFAMPHVEIDQQDVDALLDYVSDTQLRPFIDQVIEKDSECRDLAREGQIIVLEDAVQRFQNFGIEIDPEGDYEGFDSYEEMLETVESGMNGSLIFQLRGPDGAPLRLSLYSEDGRNLGFEKPHSLGYELRAFNENGLDTLTEFYKAHR